MEIFYRKTPSCQIHGKGSTNLTVTPIFFVVAIIAGLHSCIMVFTCLRPFHSRLSDSKFTNPTHLCRITVDEQRNGHGKFLPVPQQFLVFYSLISGLLP